MYKYWVLLLGQGWSDISMRNFFVFLCLLLSCPYLSGATDLSESQSRSIKNSLDKVLKEVKSKLEFFFNRKDQRSDKLKSRLIKTPIETILPEAWLEDDRDFLLPSIPTDVEIHIEDINRRESRRILCPGWLWCGRSLVQTLHKDKSQD